METSLNITT